MYNTKLNFLQKNIVLKRLYSTRSAAVLFVGVHLLFVTVLVVPTTKIDTKILLWHERSELYEENLFNPCAILPKQELLVFLGTEDFGEVEKLQV